MDNNSRSSPIKISWFEFLLKPNFLEDHLVNPNADPPAEELITVFLSQANIAVGVAKDLLKEQTDSNSDNLSVDSKDDKEPKSTETKKVKALRLLALKTAAYLKWNLDTFEKKVPLPNVHALLVELLRMTLPEKYTDVAHSEIDVSDVSAQALFALQLFHRWCLRTTVSASFLVKPSKTSNVQVPGLTDPAASVGAKEPFIQTARENCETSTEILGKLLSIISDTNMPTLQSINVHNESSESVSHDWGKGIRVAAAEFRSQICYDLGRYYFMGMDKKNAKAMFSETKSYFEKVKEPAFCHIDPASLTGYCHAVGIEPNSQSLYIQCEESRAKKFQGVVEILLKDNLTQELSPQYRFQFEEEIRSSQNRQQELLFQVQTCNMIRRLQLDLCLPSEHIQKLGKARGTYLQFLVNVCEEPMKVGSFSTKSSIKNFLRLLCFKNPLNTALQQRFSQHLSNEEKQRLESIIKENQTQADSTALHLFDSATESGEGKLEEDLRHSFEPLQIGKLITKLMTKYSKQQLLFLSDKWWVPREFYSVLESNTQGHSRIFLQILTAKARICLSLQHFERARELLLAGDVAIKDKSYKLSKLLRWEALNVDLVQYMETESVQTGSNLHELCKKARNFLSQLQIEQDIQPRQELLCNLSAFLLSTKEWDALLSCNHQNGYIQLSKLVAALVKELPLLKGSRKPARELWEAIASIFNSSKQQKRGIGTSSTVMRDSHLGLILQKDFSSYICKVKEPVTLSTFISLLTKMYMTVNDAIICDIFSEYILFWPTTISGMANINLDALGEAVKDIVDHSLQFNPCQASWLRTEGDLHYANNQYSQALKSYLKAGVVSTDFFSDAVSKNVYDDQVYKRMIRCCSYLNCHTQVAILCQFLDDVDYATAFKSLTDRSCNDAMDKYYPCIWDITILEFLVYHHSKHGEIDKKEKCMNLISQMELNSNNPAEILQEAAKMRKTRFLRAMAKQYL